MMIEKHWGKILYLPLDDPKLLYNLIIYQLGIEQIMKEIKNECKEQGESLLSFWKGYQDNLHQILSSKYENVQKNVDLFDLKLKEAVKKLENINEYNKQLTDEILKLKNELIYEK